MENLIDKKSFDKDGKRWFMEKLSDDFVIPNDKRSKVIFGFNGVGKTTLFNYLKESNDSNLEFLSYNDFDDYFDSKSGNKELIISVNINSIKSIQDTIFGIENSLKYKDNLSSIGIKNIKTFSNLEIKDLYRKLSNHVIDYNNKAKIIEIKNKLSKISIRDFVNIYDALSKFSKFSEESKKEKDKILYDSLKILNQAVDDDSSTCPVCGSNIKNIKALIINKIKKLEGQKSDILEILRGNGYYDILETDFNNYLDAYNELHKNVSLREDFFICSGDEEVFEDINKKSILLKSEKEELSKLEKVRDEFYENIKKAKPFIEDDFNKYIDVTNPCEFDDANKTITIHLERYLDEYSTGEINLITFLYRLYGFVGSDKTTLIIDDPLSSYDIINQYKICFEIVKEAANKNIIVLTHSIDLLNIINSQRKKIFDFYYIEECNKLISIMKIENYKENVIDIVNVKDDNLIGFIDLLKRKDQKNFGDYVHKVFHYSNQECFDIESGISNYQLIKYVDDFSSFKLNEFYKNAFNKILYLCALRIWVEKALFLKIDSGNTELKNDFLDKKTLGEKIDLLFPIKSSPKISNVPINFRDLLMSKKVLLNQSVHYSSQLLPFYYAMNLSLDDIAEEITQIKNDFDF